MKYLLTAILFCIVLLASAHAQMQSDSSDAVWSVVMPIASSQDIDMKQCLVGTKKDSVISDFISNIGSWKFCVDSIYFRGSSGFPASDASCFSMLSGFPKYEILAGNIKSTEFRFTPNRVGLHQAEIVIITQADTLYQNIIGEGVQPTLQILSDILDFGEVEVGNDKIIVDTVLLKNLSSNPITIANTVQLPPNKDQFSIIGGGGQFTLLGGQERPLTLQFKPQYGGRMSGRIGFEYGGAGSPAIVDLFGIGIGGLVSIPYDSAFAGDSVNISIKLENIKPEGIQALANNFSALIRFQETILTPKDFSRISKNINDSTFVEVTGAIGTSKTLIAIPMIAGLGSVEETTIDIMQINLKDDLGNIIDYDFETRSGIFKLLGICKEGGSRLFDSEGQVTLSKIAPNPTTGDFELKINLIEKGQTEIYMTNTAGLKVKDIYRGSITELGESSFKINAQDIASGMYYIVLQTPTVRKLEKIIIEK